MFKMGNGVDKILPSLYIGNVNDLKDQNQLDLYKITHVISVHDNNRKGQSDFHYFYISVTDQPNQNLSQFYSSSNDFIHSARINGGSVMIHYIGSRSMILAGVYLMSCTSLDSNSTYKAFNALKCARGEKPVGFSNPNDHFLKQLKQFESMHLKGERRRLFKKFNGEICIPSDEVEARKLVKFYDRNQTNQTNSFLNFTYNKPSTPKVSYWQRSRNLMKKPDAKENGKDHSKDASSRTKDKLSATNSLSTKITISPPTRPPITTNRTSPNKSPVNKINKLVRSNSGLYLTSNKPTSTQMSPTSGERRKLQAHNHPQSILKKQMSIDSLNIQTANLTIQGSTKSLSSSPSKSSSLLQPFDQNNNKKYQKPVSAPSGLRSNPELNK